MKVAIVTTGDEIMSGNVVDTNSAWIADKCWMLGHEVVWHGGVGDYAASIGDTCKLAAGRADVVFVSGGLGATIDDITVKSAAAAFKKKMVFHADIWREIQAFFKHVGRHCAENNRQQAYLPEGGKALKNLVGSAPGVQVKLGGAIFFFLPGVPKELYQIFNDGILPWLERQSKDPYAQKILRCFGIPEASMDDRLKGINLDDVRMSFRVTFPEVKIKLVARGANAEKSIDKVQRQIRAKIGAFVFGEGDETLEVGVGNRLKNKAKKLAIAESCTGGLISNLVTNVSGASGWFELGLVCYSNESKTTLLGVKKDTIKKYGAVSETCARQMAIGIKKASGADFGLAVTGIAGPTGGTKDKPVGTVHIALATAKGVQHVKHFHPCDRESFKILVAYEALDMVRRCLA